MKSHFELNDAEFAQRFENCSLEPSLFNHEAHLRLAWYYIKEFGVEKAIKKTCASIKQFDLVHGKGDKFHTTVTVASVKMVYHFMQKSQNFDFQTFMHKFPRLKIAFKELLDQHYGIDIFSNEEARVRYINPDILPFD